MLCTNLLFELLGVSTDVVGLELSPSDVEVKLGVLCLKLCKGVVLST